MTVRHETLSLTLAEAHALALAACTAAGADAMTAEALSEATMDVHRHGRHSVGLPHLVDYVEALRAGRINGQARPHWKKPLPAVIESDADGGIAQLGFAVAFDAIVTTAKSLGLVLFTQRNSFTTGELGLYVRRLAEEGLVALAFTNASAMVTPKPGCPPVYSTNPLAFAFPLGAGRAPVVIDQSSSATAFVNIVAAARRGETLPEGIALDRDGVPTTDPVRAMAGALLPFGGHKGANIALMVELMAAGLSGGTWSSEAPRFDGGQHAPDTGLTVLAMLPGADAPERSAAQMAFLQGLGVHVPGLGGKTGDTEIVIDAAVHAALTSRRAD